MGYDTGNHRTWKRGGWTAKRYNPYLHPEGYAGGGVVRDAQAYVPQPLPAYAVPGRQGPGVRITPEQQAEIDNELLRIALEEEARRSAEESRLRQRWLAAGAAPSDNTAVATEDMPMAGNVSDAERLAAAQEEYYNREPETVRAAPVKSEKDRMRDAYISGTLKAETGEPLTLDERNALSMDVDKLFDGRTSAERNRDYWNALSGARERLRTFMGQEGTRRGALAVAAPAAVAAAPLAGAFTLGAAGSPLMAVGATGAAGASAWGLLPRSGSPLG